MTATNQRNPALQKGPKELPFSPAGLENMKNYDPVRDGDYTGMCMPYGLMRSMNAPYPIQIFQNDKYVAFLFEVSTWFHVVPVQERTSQGDRSRPGLAIRSPSGMATRSSWTRSDSTGTRASTPSAVRTATSCTWSQTFKHIDAGHVAYKVTIDDPVYYTQPWTNERT